MKVFYLHDWDVNIQRAREIQRELREKVIIEGGPDKVRFPYIPGYLSFREIPLLLKTFEKVQTIPDVVLLDGHGIAHPRGIGLASHVGLFLDLPTVGCAKNLLVGEFSPPDKTKGSYSIVKFGEKEVGWVLRTRDNVKPIFVSPGHKIGFEKSLGVVLKCCVEYRFPEPLRQAHILANQLKRRIYHHGFKNMDQG